MKVSFGERQIALRDSFLGHEEGILSNLVGGSFRKIKDWDEQGRTVIWEGVLTDEQLKDSYQIQIHYPPAYPFKRPDIYPIKPRVENQRHQLPTRGKTELPGGLCLWPHSPDGWIVGMTASELLARAVKWLAAYENRTLDDQFAPPELERFFPSANELSQPAVILGETLLQTNAAARRGACLLIPTKSGKFAFLDLLDNDDTEATVAELTRLLGLILPAETITNQGWLRGEWFALDAEPAMPVPLSSSALLELLKRNGLSTGDARLLARRKPQLIALRYLTPAGTHWLVFRTKFSFPDRGGFRKNFFDLKLKEVNKLNALWLYRAYHIDRETIFRRVRGYKVEVLQNKSCVLLGCGAIGSRVAELLIKAGVGNLILADKEVLRAGNVSRHVLGLDCLNQNKATAMKQFLHKRNPYAKIGTMEIDIVKSPETLDTMILNSDLVVSCMGNDPAELFVSCACGPHGKSVLYSRAYLEARLGEVFISNPPNYPACFHCAAIYLNDPETAIPRPPTLPYQELVGLDGDCGAAFIPASGIDLDLVALHTARLALLVLQGEALTENYHLVRGRAFDVKEFLELRGSIREPFTLHSYVIPQSESCQFCKEAGKEVAA
jgi:molybdopterin/thiamine biosynthesis adenylyltransferase